MTRPARLLLAAAALALAPAVGSAQPVPADAQPAPQPRPVPADGTEVFRWLLKVQGIEPMAERDVQRALQTQSFDDVLVIVLGETEDPFRRWGTGPAYTAARAVQGGGAALVATDASADLGQRFNRGWPGRVTGHTVEADRRGQFHLRTDCPYVVPFRPPPNPGPEWELFEGLDRVATNDPSYLDIPQYRGELHHPIAGFPRGAELGAVGPLGDPVRFPFAAAGSRDQPEFGRPYRLLVLADPSVFINQMLVPGEGEPEKHNLQFAVRAIKFLQEGGGRKRTRCALYQNGQLVGDFAALTQYTAPRPPDVLPRIPWDRVQQAVVDVGNKAIDHVQTNDVLNKAVLGDPRDPDRQARRLRDMLAPLLVLGSVAAVAYALRRVWRARQPLDVATAPPGGRPPAPAAAAAGVFDRRQRELLRRNNVYEPVRDAVREMFAEAGAPPDAGPRLPRVVVSDAVRRPDTLRQALADLWKIAYGRPRVVTVRDWDVLGPLFERARRAYADGKWRFAAAGSDVTAAPAGPPGRSEA